MSFRTCNVIVLVSLLALGACGKDEAPTEEQLRPVRYITVSDASEFRDRSFSGTSKSSRESRLSFKVSGTVMTIPVQIGQRLNAGDLIAELDPASYVLQEQQSGTTPATSLLNVRIFSARMAATAYEQQTREARDAGVSNCPDCTLTGSDKIHALSGMDADHVTPWSKGGETTMENLTMLCKRHNRSKGNK